MIIHCCINPSEKIEKDAFQRIYKVEYMQDHSGGYWSKRVAAGSVKDAKERFIEQMPNVIYKRALLSK
jgi:Txe/YoeB family toxin of Txe-Axe toxin-antitoxin module